MLILKKHPQLSTVVIIVFFALWCYTEVTEYLERDKFVDDVTSFMGAGDRFTKQQAEAIIGERKSREKELSDRIEHLEKCLHEECK